MTDNEPDRPVDFRPIDVVDAAREDRVVGRAMTRIRSAPHEDESTLIADVATLWRPGLAAAAVFALMSLGSLAMRTRPDATAGADTAIEAQILAWAQNGYVPTNGELLAAFHGSAR